jgi:hypothetical protein
MDRRAIATRQAQPLTSTRVTTIPRRITGLYRLSIISKQPFEVDIGGRTFDTARTLDIFHETPMFIDELKNASALDFFAHGETVRMLRIHPDADAGRLSFRITAHEKMPERDELDRTLKLARVKAPLEYEGLVKHSFHGLLDAASPDADADDESGVGVDAAACAIALGLTIGLGALLVAPLLPPIILGMAGAGIGGIAPVAVVCDPSRTYINGKLFKNLKEVRVSLPSGRVVGYAQP